MKNLIHNSAMFVLFALFFIGCAKEEQQKENYTGEYSGIWGYTTPYFHEDNRYAYRNIIMNEDGGYLITTNWSNGEIQTAYYTSNGYTYNPFEILANNSCEMQFVTIKGYGNFIGDSLIETGELIFVTANYSYNGTWYAKLKKESN